MEHTHIITAIDLEVFADRRESEGIIPEFISHLIKETVHDLTLCRIPYGDAIGQPGLDGVVETVKGGRQYVPAGKSVWEIGTGGKPQVKATSDFGKRTNATLADERSQITYVVVTPHAAKWPQPKQEKWRKRRGKSGWKDIKILDGVQLEDWLREHPILGKALLKRMGLVDRIAGITLPTEHWENLRGMVSNGDPPLPPKLFLIGRESARMRLRQLFEGQEQQLVLGVENAADADDFVAACLAEADSTGADLPHRRCLLIDSADAWLTMTKLTETECAPVTPPAYYQPAPVAQSSTYLLRLEQLLAVRTAGMDQARGSLNGEREILDGHLQLCLDQPDSVSIRLLYAHTLRGMKKVRPDILPEFRARTDLLHQEKPLAEPARSVVARILAEAFAG
jgi:hypothetical protein